MATITPTPVGSDFNIALFNFLKTPGIEAFEPFVYNDDKGLPTLGVGYALLERNPTTGKWQPINLTLLQNTAGFSDTQRQTLGDKLQKAADKMNHEPGAVNPFPTWYAGIPSSANILDWLTITVPMAKKLFDAILPDKLRRMKTWLGNDTLYTSLQGSKEMMVLTSLAFNGYLGKGKCPALHKAIVDDGNRAEAWYEIRYATPSPAFRNYAQSSLFGLYNNPGTDPSIDDSKAIYRMYTDNRERMLNYEAANNTVIAQVNNAYHAGYTAKTLKDELQSAANIVKNKYVTDLQNKYGVIPIADFNPLNIQITSNETHILHGEAETNRTGSNDDLLIAPDGDYEVQMYGRAGNDVLIGNDKAGMLFGSDGNDILVGGISNDVLDGGDGADTLIGGEGQDKMYGGDGDDTFIIEGTDTDYDIFNGGAGTGDKILGGAGDDTIRLHHFTGEDRVEIIDGGGGENNIIEGTIGDDIFDFTGVTLNHIKEIRGGGGNDTYIFNHNDQPVTVEDKEGATNRVIIDGVLISKLIKKADGTYYSPDKNLTGVMVGNKDLKITTKEGSVVILNENFQEGDFGINLIDEPAAIADPDIDGITKEGDLKPVEFKDANNNPYYKYDDNNNIIVHADQAEAGRNDRLYGTAANDHLLGLDGIDSLQGKAGHDWLEGGGGKDSIYGEEGNDLIYGGTEADLLYGGVGTDLVDGGSGKDFIKGDEGDDTLIGGSESDRLFGGAGNDLLLAEEQKDMAILIQEGEAGTGTGMRGELLSGNDGEDLLFSGAGNDLIFGGAGADTIYSGAGDDNIEEDIDIYSATDDWYVTRTVIDHGTSSSYSMEFTHTYGQSVSGGDDSIFSGSGNDWVFARDGNDYVDAGSDNDVVFGGRGDDTILGQSGDDSVLAGDDLRIPANEHGSDYIDGGDGDDNISGMCKDDILMGGAGSDIISGDAKGFGCEFHGKDYIDGGSGDDFLKGNGNDDIVFGGEGNDELLGDDEVTAGEFHGNDYLSGGTGDDKLFGFGKDDTLLGGDGADELAGDYGELASEFHGADLLEGGLGDDKLFGNGGADTLIGGEGNDGLMGDNASNESLEGQYHGNDTLDGGAGNDVLFGGGGADTLIGGEGNDELMGDNASDQSLDGQYQGDDFLNGGAGDDKLWGSGGADTLIGGEGNDYLEGDSEVGVTTAFHGNDHLDGGAGDDILIGDGGNDILLGGEGNDILQGDEGDDILDGGTGEDYMNGGGGNDTYVIDVAPYWETDMEYNTTLKGDRIVETAGEGIDTVQIDVAFTLGSNFENLSLAGDSDINGTGNASDNVLIGNSGINTLSGGAGNDTLHGGEEADSLLGGTGNDTYIITESNSISENVGEGTDTVQADFDYSLGANFENLLLTGTADLSGTGNELANTLTGNSGINTLAGGSGNDTLDGGATADTLIGGIGDDSYIFDGADSIIENVGEGIDTIIARVSHELGANLENLTLSGADAINATGNELNNTLTGNSGDNLLVGGEGADTLSAGAGNDTLTGGIGSDSLDGGAGDDAYIFNLGDGADTIGNYDAAGVDTISFGAGIVLADINLAAKVGNNLVLTIGNSGDQLTINNWFAGTAYQIDRFSFADTTVKTGAELLAALPVYENGTADNDYLQGYEGVDIMIGGAGNDTLTGLAGNDTLTGGLGKDTLDGGTGDDTYIFNVGDGADTLNNNDAEGIDTVAFGSGITLADLHDFIGINNNLVIKIGSNGDKLTINNWFAGVAHQPDRFTFAGGTEISAADLVAGRTIPMAVNQTLNGTAADDTLTGGLANDLLAGLAGNDTLTGGQGADTVDGGTGNDTYIFNIGDGEDTINNYDTTGIDTVSFGAGIALSDLNLATKVGYHLVLSIGTGGDQLTINNWYYGSTYQVDRFQFADGSVKTGAEILAGLPVHVNGTTANDTLSGTEGADILSGGAGDDTLWALAGNDTLTGGTGKDTLDGGAGNDTYTFNWGDGADTINNNDSTGIDTISFGAGIVLADINQATKVDNNLILRVGNNGDQLTINNWFYNRPANQIDRFVFADGTVKTGNEILAGLPNYVNGTVGNDTLYGYDGVDIMNGGIGNDHIYGYAGDDSLYGGEGGDNLGGDEGNDLLVGGIGNDSLNGGVGNDTYIFNAGDGADTISDSDNTSGNVDTIKFGAGIAASDITLSHGGYTELILSINGTDDQIKIYNWGYEARYRIERIEFADGTIWDEAAVLTKLSAIPLIGTDGADSLYAWSGENKTLQGLGGDDRLYGDNGNDILEGGVGNDILYGEKGNDVYLFNLGDGQDTITDGDATAGNLDTLRFGAGIAASAVTFSRGANYSVILTINDTNDRITINNWGDGTNNRIERVEFADGTLWDTAYIQSRIANLPIIGTAGSDTLNAWQNENAVLQGLGGNDTLIGGIGTDILEGGTGFDYLRGGTGNDTYLFNRGDGQDTISDSDTTVGNLDTLRFGAAIAPSDITFTRMGGVDDDLILGISGTDDQVNIKYWGNQLVGNNYRIEHVEFADGTVWDVDFIQAQATRFLGTSGYDNLVGGVGNDTLEGGAGNDSLSGGVGNDILKGETGNDFLYGGNGNDTIDGGVGNDSLRGETGNDTYLFNRGDGQDTINDYDTTPGSQDTLRFGASIAASDITLSRNGNDLIFSIIGTSDQVKVQTWSYGTSYRLERVEFSDGAVWDTAYLQSQIALMAPIVGTSGNDSLSAWVDTNDTLQGLAGNDFLYGSNGADTLVGGLGNDTLEGHTGNDIYLFNLGDGQDTIVESDTTFGNIDTLRFGEGIAASDITFARSGNDLVVSINATTDQLTLQNWGSYTSNRIERIEFFDGAVWDAAAIQSQIAVLPVAGGTEGSDTLYAWAGENGILHGGGGNDVLTANFSEMHPANNGVLDGGAGDDQISSSNAGSLIIGGTGADQISAGGEGTVVLFNRGDGEDNHNSYSYQQNTISLGGGIAYSDLWFSMQDYQLVLEMGAGDRILIDSYNMWNIKTLQIITEAMPGYNPASTNNLYNKRVQQFDFARLVEQFIAFHENDPMNSSWELAPRLAGASLGGSNTDALGGAMAYQYGMHGSLDQLTEVGMQMQLNDARFGVAGQHLNGCDAINGGDGNDTLIGGNTDDTINGGAGADTLIGGGGDDTYIVDNSGDVVTENVGEGSDTVKSSIDYTLGDNLENLHLTGAAAINGTGNALDNILLGNDGDNILVGQAGNDRLDGGSGNDVLLGGIGNDIYVIDNVGDVMTENADEGNDTIESVFTYTLGANVENLTLAGIGEINGTGNELDNIIIGNNAGNILVGGAGKDRIDGGAGVDTMIGGTGDDTYLTDNTNDLIVENAGEGNDTIEATFDFTLAANLENLTLIGSAINGTGNELDNILKGNSYVNTLTGRAGNDTYVVDYWDVVIENDGEGIDTIETSIGANLSANVENLILTGTAAINGTGNDLGNILTGNANTNHLSGGDGNDTINGMAGNDYLIGGSGDDQLDGGDGDDHLWGDNGDNTGTGNDTLYGGIGKDNLQGAGGNDLLYGGADQDTLFGEAGNDYLDGGSGTDHLIGGAGDDTFIVDTTGDSVAELASEGTDTVYAGATFILGSNVENLILTGTSNINGTGNSLSNILTGNSGNNILTGGTGADIMTGGLGDDTYDVDNVGDIVVDNAGEGTDTIQAGITYVLAANFENLVLTGGSAINGTGNTFDNVLTGNTAANSLAGGEGNDTLTGGAGDDILDGGAGVDQMLGGLGNDTYVVDVMADTVIENSGQGTDVVKAGITYTLGANVENLILTTTTAINGTGNSLANVLTGNSADNTLTGGSGNDTLNGGEGDDILDGGTGDDKLLGGVGNDTYVIDVATDTITEAVSAGTDTVKTSITYTLGSNLENLTLTGTSAISGTGNSLDNVLTGNSGANILTGGSGNDTLYGGDGNDTLTGGAGSDQMMGGMGNDTYVVDAAGDTISENTNEGTDLVQSGITYTLGDNLENLTLTGTSAISGTGNSLANILTGNSGANTLNGGDGNDTLNGGDGNDILDGGAGIDRMVGGLGNDNYLVDVSGETIAENADQGTDVVQAAITYTLGNNLENLVLMGTSAINGSGNALANVLTGNSGANTLTGGAGNDTLNGGDGDDILDGGVGDDRLLGGLGNDTYLVDVATDIVTESAAAGTDTVKAGFTYTLGSNVENLLLTGTAAINGTGNSLDNVLTGNSGINILTGGSGNDTLNGGAGDDILDGGLGLDTLLGGTGNDTYIVDNIGDMVTENASAGTDSVQSGIAYTLGANVENLTLTGTSAINGTGNSLANVLNGNSGVNTLLGGEGNDTLNGGGGNDILDGGIGADKMLGGLGNDTYMVDVSTDTITENVDEGTDTVQSAITHILAANVENLILTGTSAINGTGNMLANVLTGNFAANTLLGGEGNDTLNGADGDDILDGGIGDDRMVGGLGNDTYLVDILTDIVTESAAAGTDTVQAGITYTLGSNVENLLLTGTTAINGTGNGLDNVLTGNSGANTLTGGAGIDTLNGGAGDDILDGGTGVDTLLGGTGNDTYIVDNIGDIVTEITNAGTDTVQSAIAYTLGANVENLTLTGTSAINGTGNTLANMLAGNSGANTLSGETGNDTINGGLGNDTLSGGAGADIFVFDTALNASTNKDSISDFAAGLDKIHVDKDIFTTLSSAGTLSSAFFNASSTGLAGDENDYFLYNTSTGALLYDLDGNGTGVAVQFATLTSKPTITEGDFLVIA